MKRGLLIIYTVFVSTVLSAQSADAYIRKGNEYYKQAEFDLAETQYRQALDKEPKNNTAQYNLANALYREKKYDEAHVVLNKLITRSSNDVKETAYYNAGAMYSKTKDLMLSIDAYKNALRLNPNDTQARENLQKALAELKKQQNKQNQSKQQSNMSQSQAEKKLQQLQEREKQLQERLQGNNRKSNSMAQDW